MKTTLDIADPILARAKRLARESDVTLRSLAEEGLLYVLEKKESRRSHEVKPVTYGGRGLTPEFQNASWQRILDASYEGRGT